MSPGTKPPLPVFADQIIGSMVISYRANAALLKAMRQFVQGCGALRADERAFRGTYATP